MDNNVILEITEKVSIPDITNDEALAKALFQEEQVARNQMFYNKSILTKHEKRCYDASIGERSHKSVSWSEEVKEPSTRRPRRSRRLASDTIVDHDMIRDKSSKSVTRVNAGNRDKINRFKMQFTR